jgi:5-hydroxyisourate hydrolase
MSLGRISTHVLDTTAGRPASGVPVRLEFEAAGGWEAIGSGVTDDDGRVQNLCPSALSAGNYRIEFDQAAYFQQNGAEHFFHSVRLGFAIDDPTRHYHLPLLINPFATTSYRGS